MINGAKWADGRLINAHHTQVLLCSKSLFYRALIFYTLRGTFSVLQGFPTLLPYDNCAAMFFTHYIALHCCTGVDCFATLLSQWTLDQCKRERTNARKSEENRFQ